jgi:carboxyl-terminal processing protease
MKQHPIKSGFFISIILGISILLFAFNYKAKEKDNLRRELLTNALDYALFMTHYSPAPLDDSLSVKTYHLYLKTLDYRKQFLLKSEVKQLEKYKYKIDDQLKSGDFEFFDLSLELIESGTERVNKLYEDILDSGFDYNENEEFELDPEKIDFAASYSELKDRWRKQLKYEVINRILSLETEQEEAAKKSDTVRIKSFDELEKIAREKIKKRYHDYLHRLEKLEHDDFLSKYLNSFLQVNDPHTSYFPPKDKKNFDINMAGKLEGIGAQLTQKNIYIEISKVIPGSPAYKGGELEVKDKILKVAQEGEPPIDVVDMRLDEAIQYIRGKKGTTVILTIQKTDGTIKDVSIVRDVINLDYTYAKSAVIYDPLSNRKIGIINLPSFYVDFNDSNSRNCYTDVKKEIDKLKAEKINALIFDLRSNGGGSLQHVVKIAGLFIDQGPIVQVKNKMNKIKTHSDINEGVYFDKPMVILVNETSASASEIFAAAMQDYHRAIIMGGRTSFGKGTVQSFYSLDELLSKKPEDMKSLGSLKVTLQKFYRINGGSTQLKGVSPEIHTPDYLDYIEVGEKDLDYPLPWDKIPPALHSYWSPGYNVKKVIQNSIERIKSDTNFIKIDQVGQIVKARKDSTLISLELSKFRHWDKSIKKSSEQMESIGKDTLGLDIRIPKMYLSEIEGDTTKLKIAKDWIEKLKKDAVIHEASLVGQDMILLKK